MRSSEVIDLQQRLRQQAYLADRGLATSLHLALALGRPLLLEGDAGVGKTELAKALAAVQGAELVRLQCYEGIEAHQALYEWDYTRQLLYVRALGEGRATEEELAELFGARFLLERPLLRALRAGSGAVLLIDEIDRSDDEFEAFLLEVLSDYQVSVPELGTIRADVPPAVVLTSNRTRELHDALKRRCLYHWIDLPGPEREVEVLRLRAPDVNEALARSVVIAVGRVRELDLLKRPGVAETIDWARALTVMGADELNADVATDTLGALTKDRDDRILVAEAMPTVLS